MYVCNKLHGLGAKGTHVSREMYGRSLPLPGFVFKGMKVRREGGWGGEGGSKGITHSLIGFFRIVFAKIVIIEFRVFSIFGNFDSRFYR